MGVKTDSIKCPNCGSVDVINDGDGIFHCNSCNGKFLINLDDNILNEIKKLKDRYKNPEEDFNTGIATKVKYSEEEFKKEVFKFLRDNENIPSYVFDEMELDDIKIIIVPLIHVHGHADVNYSRLVGFDRIESHTEFKKYKDASGNEHIDAYEVKETKTDWHTENGMLSGESYAIDYNSDTRAFTILGSVTHLADEEFEELDNDTLDDYKIDANALNKIKRDIISNVYYSKITKSGDHQKNESYNGRTTIDKSTLVLAKIYAIKIKLRNEDLILYSPSYGVLDVDVIGDIPQEDDAAEFENKVDELLDEKKALMKKPNLISTLLFVLAGVSFLGLLILGISLNVVALTILSFIIPIICIIAGVIFKVKAKEIHIQYNVKIDKLDEERDTRIQNKKNAGYNQFYND